MKIGMSRTEIRKFGRTASTEMGLETAVEGVCIFRTDRSIERYEGWVAFKLLQSGSNTSLNSTSFPMPTTT
jgi:hypothetical protein